MTATIDFLHDQAADDTHIVDVVQDINSRQTKGNILPKHEPSAEPILPPANRSATSSPISPEESTSRATNARSAPKVVPSHVDLFDPLLVIYAEGVDDLERIRTATANRLRAVTTEHGLDENSPDVRRLQGILDAIKVLEDDAVKVLEAQMKRHPMGSWLASQKGVGDKQAARLLSLIGDPYWHVVHDRPRTVSELWAYCGLHTLPVTGGDQAACDTQWQTVAARHRKGQQSNWSTQAKTRTYLIAAKCVMFDGVPDKNGRPRARSPFRDTYDARKARTLETHPDWTDGHRHADATRIVSKEILKQMWREARRLHEC